MHVPIPKLLTWEKAARRVDFWKSRGKQPAAVVGTFDLLHAGHVELLHMSWACADKVIVCLRSDESAQRVEGAGRPIQEFQERATVLGALRHVDLIVPFPLPGCADETAAGLLELLRPHILVTGSPVGTPLPGCQFCGEVLHAGRRWDVSTDVRIAAIEAMGLLKFAARHRSVDRGPRGVDRKARSTRHAPRSTLLTPPRRLPP